ncbi:hypothetical protein TL16_g07499 [Triparma laevis f. inornata]|uniref:Apyrase n=2 Tax=Triparma laevis TaxID=1534972 RepID=A0A9W7DT43_9STRA|nr:hypothetical protein TrLO_g7309 [Triparma laevis f. longispina]GMH77698.1 hypothetical protein TL16_g07499 [Triparma laevis f. inornata]
MKLFLLLVLLTSPLPAVSTSSSSFNPDHPLRYDQADTLAYDLSSPKSPEEFSAYEKRVKSYDMYSEPIGPILLSAPKSSPLPSPTTSHILMIDAGSGGSRLHIYEHLERKFNILPPPLTDVTTDSRWTSRLKPGISTFDSVEPEYLPEVLAEYLSPLLHFAQKVLKDKKDSWEDFPIYLKATGGMRTLPTEARHRIIDAVRSLFNNEHPEFFHNPFGFESKEQIRVISGEEEAIYGWTAVNYLMGNLLETSYGSGTVSSPPNKTYGALDMGGASTQISFYEPHEDILSNLFKLQLGEGKHWNVYAHSFLYFGVNLGRERLGARIVHQGGENKEEEETPHGEFYNPCLPGSYTTPFSSSIHLNSNGLESWKPSSGNASYTVTFYGGEKSGSYEKCSGLTDSLLRLESNGWCNFAHGGDCSFAGIYQPPLPSQSLNFGEFFAFANYLHLWKFAKLPVKASIGELKKKAEAICEMSWAELKEYDKAELNGKTDDDELPNMCFLASYAHSMLSKGYGFPPATNITVASVVGGQKIGWALGASLYEINSLPWEYATSQAERTFSWAGVAFNIGLLLCCGVLSYKVYQERQKTQAMTKKHEKRYQYESYGSVVEEAGLLNE